MLKLAYKIINYGKKMKKIISISLVLSLFLALGSSVSAKNDKKYAPEMEEAEDGVYDVEGRPDMKVKVFVHKEKAKPGGGGGGAALVCSADPDSLAVVGDAGWQLPSSVIYRLNPGSVPSSVGSGNLAAIVGNSFSEWTSEIPGTVSLAQGVNTSATRSRYDGQNIIAWGRTSNGVLGVTYVWYYIASGNVAEVDTIMNNRVSWKWSNSNTCADPSAYDAGNIMIHELGHWFGLDDEYDTSYSHNTMFGYGSKGEVKKNTLTEGDAVGIQNLY